MPKNNSREKTKLHPRNKHRERYDFTSLITSYPELSEFVALNKYGDESIDFFNPKAVKALNKALLMHFYHLKNWDVPDGYLCPPIPGRADYIHYIADLLGNNNFGKTPTGPQVKGYDIGVGANCVYPIIGQHEYGWSFIGSDIDKTAFYNAKSMIGFNANLKNHIDIRHQVHAKDFFYGVLQKEEVIDFSMSNPPFHASQKEAQSEAVRKLKNLTNQSVKTPTLNFGGQPNELWYEGGEVKFITAMIRESKKFATSCFWFSSLVSKQSHLKPIYDTLKKVEAIEVKTIPMGQGNKTSRIVAWTFLTPKAQKIWKENRWK